MPLFIKGISEMTTLELIPMESYSNTQLKLLLGFSSETLVRVIQPFHGFFGLDMPILPSQASVDGAIMKCCIPSHNMRATTSNISTFNIKQYAIITQMQGWYIPDRDNSRFRLAFDQQ